MVERTLPFDFSLEYWEAATILNSRPAYRKMKYFIRNIRYVLAGPTEGLTVRIYYWFLRLDRLKKRLKKENPGGWTVEWARVFSRRKGKSMQGDGRDDMPRS